MMYKKESDRGDLSKFTEAQNQWQTVEAEASTSLNEINIAVLEDDRKLINGSEAWQVLNAGIQIFTTEAKNDEGDCASCLGCNRPSSAVLREKEILLRLSQTPFSDQNVIHRRMLFSVYQFLTQNFNDRPSRSGSHWENIGFQGNDPATDFRGVGVLGLLQFLRFVSNKKQENLVRDLFALSRHPVQNFPFAAVGLNFTKILLGLLRMGKLENLTNSTRKNWSLFDCLTFCYDGVFSRFYYVWNNSEPKMTIVDFGFVMKNLGNYASDHRNRMKWIKCHNM